MHGGMVNVKELVVNVVVMLLNVLIIALIHFVKT